MWNILAEGADPSAWVEILKVLLDAYGPGGTLCIFAVLLAVFAGWHLYQLRRKDRETDRLVEEKERAVQRAASHERHWRILYLKSLGWTDARIERLVISNDFASGPEARDHLEGRRAREDASDAAGRKPSDDSSATGPRRSS